ERLAPRELDGCPIDVNRELGPQTLAPPREVGVALRFAHVTARIGVRSREHARALALAERERYDHAHRAPRHVELQIALGARDFVTEVRTRRRRDEQSGGDRGEPRDAPPAHQPASDSRKRTAVST